MAKQKFPYQAFTLSAAMIVRPITLLKTSSWGDSWHEAEGGRRHHVSTLYATTKLAIAAGDTILKSQEIRLDKAHANLVKRRANLAKAKKEGK